MQKRVSLVINTQQGIIESQASRVAPRSATPGLLTAKARPGSKMFASSSATALTTAHKKPPGCLNSDLPIDTPQAHTAKMKRKFQRRPSYNQ